VARVANEGKGAVEEVGFARAEQQKQSPGSDERCDKLGGPFCSIRRQLTSSKSEPKIGRRPINHGGGSRVMQY
jgi:hypothetical protein